MALTNPPTPQDMTRLRQAMQQLSHLRLGTGSSPVFEGLTLNGLTASRLVWTESDKSLASKDLIDLVAGTANEVNVADDGSGGIILGIVDPLIVAKGGTGVATLTDHGILLGSGTGAVTPLGGATNGQLPVGSTGADPVLAALTGTANQVTVTNGAGTITLSTPQDIHTGASPEFVAATFSGLTATRLMASNGSKLTVSTDLVSWVDGSDIIVDDDSDGSITLNMSNTKLYFFAGH